MDQLAPLSALLSQDIPRIALAYASENEANSRSDSSWTILRRLLKADSHGRQTAWLSLQIGRKLDLSPQELSILVAAAATHDVGKLLVPKSISDKCGALSSHEMDVMRCHTLFGQKILDTIFSEQGASYRHKRAEVALLHHEHWDGGGYPHGLKGSQIPLLARIVAVADVFDALTRERSYKPAWPIEQAATAIATRRGLQFDPACADPLLALVSELEGSWPNYRISEEDRAIDLEGWLFIPDQVSWS